MSLLLRMLCPHSLQQNRKVTWISNPICNGFQQKGTDLFLLSYCSENNSTATCMLVNKMDKEQHFGPEGE